VILFDLSRLLSRAGRETPTGIDRVELAYAEHLLAAGTPLCLTMLTPSGRFGQLPRAAAEEYVQTVAAAWRHHAASPQLRRAKRLAHMLRAAALLRGERGLPARRSAETGPFVYLLVSHHHLEKRRAIARLQQRLGAAFICLVHDLIPIEFPEYALPGQDQKHRRRIETAAALADGVIVNSRVTRARFEPFLARAGRAPPVLVAPFGVELGALPAAADRTPTQAPYFVCIGTIEARKNHLLLLNLWRQLVDLLGEATPRLVLVGQRGWETESAIDMLERCPALRGVVVERNNLADAEVRRLLAGACALLLPSFAEGFGFPLVEALALRVPVLCSTLPALRENGGEVPEYLDPLDGPGWRAAVVDYSRPDSPRRAAQLRRLNDWTPPRWQDHFAAVDALIAQVRAMAEPATAAAADVPRRGEVDGRETAGVR
jgi:glycosyltransferase involved in cell wall biosynthesis